MLAPASVRPASTSLALLCLLGAVACEVPLDARLLEVHAVEPDRIEPAVRVQVEGEGFPAGRTGRVLLDGVLSSPGAEPAAVRAMARGRALSTELLEVAETDGLIEDVGGRGTFHGTVRVEFDAADGSGAVAGTAQGVTLDFAPPARERLTAEIERRRRAEAMLTFLGVTPGIHDASDDGIQVDSVRSDGPAALAGLSKGDRIVAIDDIRIGALTDLVPPPGVESTVLSVERAGEAGTLRLRVPLDAASGDSSEEAWLLGAGLAGVFLLLLLFVAPTARLTSRLVRALAFPAPRRGQGRRPPPADGAWQRIVDHLRHGAWRVVGWVAAVMALGVLPFSARVYTGGVDVGILLFSAFATRLVVGTEARPGARAERSWPSLLRRFCLDGLPAAAAAGAIVVFSGTFRLAGIVEHQGGEPWAWYLFSNPVAFVLFPVFVAATLVPERGEDDRQRGVAAQVAGRAQRFVMAGLGTALFLGGWKLPGIAIDPLEGAPALRLLGAGAFVLKAWLLLGASERLIGSPGRWRWTVPVSLLCVAVATTSLLEPWPAMLAVVSGPVLVSVTALVLAWGLLRLRRRAPEPLTAHPFL